MIHDPESQKSQWQVLWPRVTAKGLQLVMGFSSQTQVVICQPNICCGRPALWQAAEHMELWQVSIVAFRQSRLADIVAGQHCGRLAEHMCREGRIKKQARPSILTGRDHGSPAGHT